MAEPVEISIPSLPARHDQFLEYVSQHPDKPMRELVEPYRRYDTEMRKVFAQQPGHDAAKTPNIVPVFNGHEKIASVRARDLKNEDDNEKDCYIMPLKDEDRRPHGSPAIVQSLKDFRTNFNVFSESSLADLDWSNVVAAGSAVVTSLLAVPGKHGASKRALREYYHEQLAPASDVDLFIYGLDEKQAKEKIKQIEQNIRDAILVESTTIRTKNAITIASQYPTRHVQIVLRIYKSISEILTGFDVDCSCAAYDGKQVWASPRALAAYITQTNTIDLTRRSPSYENRQSKYAHRGFEVYWPNLDRSRVDPTIFERSFGRTEGLARLLILEKLPKSRDRDAYLDQRRAERGRPAVNRWRMNRRMIRGNIKNDYEDEVAEWVDADDVSDYHTFTIPYGPKFHAKKLEKLLYTKDLLLNAEWNKPKDREVNLHRHPAFFGRAEDVFHDCCGYCPKPATMEEEEAAEEEGKVYISGDIQFIKDDPGRQTIGSFNPITADDWTEMAYVGNTEMLCKAIVDGDSDFVRTWLEQDGNNPNTRDYTGRAPLHLAATNATPEIVQLLIDRGARLVARLVDGKTALHLAAMRGSVEIVSALLRKSEANDEEEQTKIDAKRAARAASKGSDGTSLDTAMKDANIGADESDDEDSDVDMVDDAEEDENMDATTETSMVNIKSPAPENDDKALDGDDNDEPDVYDVNVLAWDTAVSPLHLAIVNGHIDVVKLMVEEFGADVLLPIKLFNDYDKSARAAILTLVLALRLPIEKARDMTRVLIQLGATTAQADLNEYTAFQYCVADRPDLLELLVDADKTGVARAINHISLSGYRYQPEVTSPLITAIKAKDSLTALFLLTNGAKPEIHFDAYIKAYQARFEGSQNDSIHTKKQFDKSVQQPIISAVQCELPDLAKALLEEHGADPNSLTPTGWNIVHDENSRRYQQGSSLLNEVKEKLEELRKWKPKSDKIDEEPPKALKDDLEYLAGLQDGSYALWSAKKQLNAVKHQYKQELKDHEKRVESAKEPVEGEIEKKAAIEDMIKRYEDLESALLKTGAKTFKELYPDIKDPDERHQWQHRGWEQPKPKAFEIEFRFRNGSLAEEAQKRYLSLFDAAWKGDLQTVKQMTLTPWKNADDEDQPPLTIAAQDQHNLTPFAIAVLQGQFELATAMMEIARAQYAPPDGPKQRRYRLDGGGDDDDSDAGSDDDVPLYSDIVDDEFTIETIGEVSTQVKSRTKAIELLQMQYPVTEFIGGPLRSSPQSSNGFSYFGPRRQHTMAGKRTNTGSLKAPSNHLSDLKRSTIGQPTNLIQFALHNDDQDLLVYLLDLGGDVVKADARADDDRAVGYFSIYENDYLEAIKLDRPHLLAEIVKRTGAGIPLNQLIKKAGVEITEKPKYYQGLSVYGKKRKDWADAGRGMINYQVVENHRPGLLEAARHQSLETVEWFLSDAPLRCYKDFAASHRDDKRIKSLSEAKGGFEAMASKFLSTRSNLAISCCLLGRPMPETIPLLRFLMKTMPEAINAKSQEGHTPLQISFWHYREEAAKLLLDAGADQTTRDKSGNNIVHSLLRRPVSTNKKLETLSRMLDLIDKRLISDLFIERSSEHPGAITPLAQWVKQVATNTNYAKHAAEVLRIILRYSGGQELNIINGEGQTPLHVTVREKNLPLTKVLLEHDPSLLLRENATGRTPFEMAEDTAISSVCSNPPPLPGNNNYSIFRSRQPDVSNHWATDIVRREARAFIADDNSKDSRSTREKIWDLLREKRAEMGEEAKRKLVTLNEANEVARRLASKKSGQRYSRRNYQHEEKMPEEEAEEETQDGLDEVALWMPQARSYLEDDKEEKKGGLING